MLSTVTVELPGNAAVLPDVKVAPPDVEGEGVLTVVEVVLTVVE